MKIQHLLLLCFTLLAFNCSKSDDTSDNDNQLPEASSSLIIDEGAATEIVFSNILPQGNWGCSELEMRFNLLESNELIMTNFLLFRDNLTILETGSIELNSINRTIRFKINNIDFVDTSGTITITKFEQIYIDDELRFIISGSANAILEPNGSATAEQYTINFNFQNILATSIGVAC